MSEAARPIWRRLVGPLVSIVAIGALLWVVDVRATWQALSEVRPIWLAVAAVLASGSWVAQAVRWGLVLPRQPRIHTARLVRLVMIGLFGNLVMPLRAGDLVRVVLTSRALGGRFGRALASVGLDRLLDVATLLVLGGLVGFLVRLPDGWTAAFRTLSLGLGLLALTLGVLVARSAWGHALLDRLPALPVRDRLRTTYDQLVDGVAVLRRPAVAAGVGGMSLLQWGLTVGAVWACLAAFGTGLGIGAAVLFTVATNLGSALPSAPSAAGVYHTFGVLALAPFAISPEDGMAISLVSHGLFVALQLLGGAASVWAEGGLEVLRARPLDGH